MDEKLKPCPFCGGKAEFLQFTNENAQIECTFCHCKTDVFEHDVRIEESWIHSPAIIREVSKYSWQKAAEAWNRRVEDGIKR